MIDVEGDIREVSFPFRAAETERDLQRFYSAPYLRYGTKNKSAFLPL